MAYTTKIRGNIIISNELALLSKAYCRMRDESGEGHSTFPSVNVRQNGKIVGIFPTMAASGIRRARLMAIYYLIIGC